MKIQAEYFASISLSRKDMRLAEVEDPALVLAHDPSEPKRVIPMDQMTPADYQRGIDGWWQTRRR